MKKAERANVLAVIFILEMDLQQFGHRDANGARRQAEKLGGWQVSYMSFAFPDGSAAYLSEQLGWKKKGTDYRVWAAQRQINEMSANARKNFA